AVAGALATRRSAALCVGVVALALAQLASPVGRDAKLWLDVRRGVVPEASWEAQFGSPGEGYAQPTSLGVAAYLRERARPEDCVLVWAFDPLPIFASGVPSCSRFGFNLPLVAEFSRDREQLRDELVATLARRPPAFVVIASRDAHMMAPGTSEENLASFAALRDLLAKDYSLARQVDFYRVYERSNADGR
ncbi:MAG: hypothetical protein ACREI8_12575, partial [Myxococcota bacterium]